MTLANAFSDGTTTMWFIIWTGEWWANVGVPFVLAIIALAAAVWAVLAQLKADRDAAHRERQQVHAERFADSLHSAASSLTGLKADITASVGPIDGARMSTSSDRLLDPLTLSRSRAGRTIGSDNAVADVNVLVSTLSRRLQHWIDLAQVEVATVGGTPDDARTVIGYLLDTYIQAFTLTAEAFEDWDGTSALPVSSVRQPHAAIHLPRSVGSTMVAMPTTLMTTPFPSSQPDLNSRIATEQFAMRSVFNALNAP